MQVKAVWVGVIGAAMAAGGGLATWVGTPIFGEQQVLGLTLASGSVNRPLSVADFDQDGFDDLVVELILARGGVAPAVLLNQSGNGFVEVWVGPVGDHDDWQTADVNGDGYPDLVEVEGNTAWVYINQFSLVAACPSDFDKTGATEMGDLLFLLIHWGTCEDS